MPRSVWNELSELVIGTLPTVISVTVHMTFDWLFITNYVHYLLAMNVGALVGIIASLQRRPGRSTVRPQQITAPDLVSQTG